MNGLATHLRNEQKKKKRGERVHRSYRFKFVFQSKHSCLKYHRSLGAANANERKKCISPHNVDLIQKEEVCIDRS